MPGLETSPRPRRTDKSRRTLERKLTRAILAGELAEGSRVLARSEEDGAIEPEVAQPTAV